MVLSYGDLSELNILVDPSNGHITGLIDWAEAAISPLGISLWGLENLLGSMNAQGLRYNLHQDSVRARFWQSFEEAVGHISDDDRRLIAMARMAGQASTCYDILGRTLQHGLEGEDHITDEDEIARNCTYADRAACGEAPGKKIVIASTKR